MKIMESAENYLETILELKKQNGQVRSIDIANALGFSKPSISYAMKQFRENGYILVDGGGYITLTEKGMDIATRVLERHTVLSNFLIALGVEAGTAMEDACKMEHDISEESFGKIKAWMLANRTEQGRK